MDYPQFYLADYNKKEKIVLLIVGGMTREISCIGYIGEWPIDCGKAVDPA